MLTVLFASSPITERDGFSMQIEVTSNVIQPRIRQCRNLAEIKEGFAEYSKEVEETGRGASLSVIPRKQRGERKPAGFDAWKKGLCKEVNLDAVPMRAA
jgi:hypothetical protein